MCVIREVAKGKREGGIKEAQVNEVGILKKSGQRLGKEGSGRREALRRERREVWTRNRLERKGGWVGEKDKVG